MEPSMWSIFCVYILIVCSLLIGGPLLSAAELESVTPDSVFYHITWPGNFIKTYDKDDNSLLMRTANNEEYKCSIPLARSKYSFEENIKSYEGKTPRELIEPLFIMPSCSYRIESYWTYELCHGKHIKQYHEEKESGKDLKLQEYFLGYYKAPKEPITKEPAHEMPTVRLQNVDYAYVAVNMTDGTICDINGRPRETRLLYICHEDGKGEMYEMKETSSCHYDVVIFTKLVCSHPAFQLRSVESNNIQCFSVDGSTRRPMSLDALEMESAKQRSPMPIDPIEEPASEPAKDQDTKPQEAKQTENQLATLENVLSGRYCFTGGRGWWLHELCLGRFIKQFHIDRKSGQRTDIVLGVWNEARHREWLTKNAEKRYAVGSNIINLHYSQGDFCELLGDYRTTLVKLVCAPHMPQSEFTIQLSEPAACRYLLIVESALVCSVLDYVDADGIPKYET